MKYLKLYEESDNEDLLKSLKDLSNNLDRLKSRKNRGRLHKHLQSKEGGDAGKISDEFVYYFVDLQDDGGISHEL